MIFSTIKKYHLKNVVSYLCSVANVSRSGYHRYFSLENKKKNNLKNQSDEILRDNILKAYEFKGRKKGARQIKMTLQNQFNINYNLKRIRRIMEKYDIYCPIRKANPYRRMIKANKEHRTLPNILNRNFKQNIPGRVLLTDITYLFYGEGKKAYLSTIKDGFTNEILAHNISSSLCLDIAIDTIHKLMKNMEITLDKDAFIHSDQGAHYTSPQFQKIVKDYGLSQSMSRRGNCWYNAPLESFFGHFKDESYINSCQSLEELKIEIDDYMDYYNIYRNQWGLKKMTPIQYRNHLLDIA